MAILKVPLFQRIPLRNILETVVSNSRIECSRCFSREDKGKFYTPKAPVIKYRVPVAPRALRTKLNKKTVWARARSHFFILAETAEPQNTPPEKPVRCLCVTMANRHTRSPRYHPVHPLTGKVPSYSSSSFLGTHRYREHAAAAAQLLPAKAITPDDHESHTQPFHPLLLPPCAVHGHLHPAPPPLPPERSHRDHQGLLPRRHIPDASERTQENDRTHSLAAVGQRIFDAQAGARRGHARLGGPTN